MATQNLLDVIKAGPKKTIVTTPKKSPELFVPSKISEAPKSTGQKLIEIIKGVTPTQIKEKTSELKPKDILNIPTSPGELVKEIIKPYSKEVGKELVTSTKETGKAVKEIFTTDKSGAIKANNLWQAISGIPASIVTPAVTKAIEFSGQGDRIANTLIDLGKKEAKLAGLDQTKLSDTDYLNLGATNIDVATAGLSFLVAKGISKGSINSLIKGLKIEGDKIKQKTGDILDTYATNIGAKVNLLPETKTKSISDIIPDKNKLQLSDAELDKKINEAKSPTTTIKLTPELVKEYSIAKKQQPDLTLEQYKLQKDLTKDKKLNQEIRTSKIVEQPKVKKADLLEVKDIDFKINDITPSFKGFEDSPDYLNAKKNTEALKKVTKGLVNQEALDKLETGDYEVVTHSTILEGKGKLNEDIGLKPIIASGEIQARKNTDFGGDITAVSFRPNKETPYTGEYVVEFIVPKKDIRKDYGGNENDAFTLNNIPARDFISIQKRDDYKPTNIKQSKAEVNLIEEIKKQPKLKEIKPEQPKAVEQPKVVEKTEESKQSLYKVLESNSFDNIKLDIKKEVDLNDYYKAHDNFMYGDGKRLPTVRTKKIIDDGQELSIGDEITLYARGTEGKNVTGKIEDIIVHNWDDFIVKIKDGNGKVYYTEPRSISNINEIKKIPNKPKVELSKQVTSMKGIDESIDKNILDIETKITKGPVLEDGVYKIAVTPEKLSQLTRGTLLGDEGIQGFGNYARKSTDVSYGDPTKLTYNVYFKKKPESDLGGTDFKFGDIKLDEVVGIEKRTDKTETPLVEEIKKQPKVEENKKQPKVEKTKKSATQELSDLQKQKSDLEKRVKNKPQLQRVLNQVNKKISELEIKIKEQPKRLEKTELFPEETPITKFETPTQRVREKLTKKRAKEIKKAIFDELAERRKIRADKIKQEQDIIKTEEQKIKQNQELIQENRRKELEEIYLKTDNVKDFEDIVYNDNILSDDNKIKLLEEVQELETMKTGKSDIDIKETGDIFATPEEKAIQQKFDKTKNLQDIISADINKSPDIKFELGVIQQGLQKVPGVRETFKAGGKLFIDIRNKLNNVMVITKQGLQGLGDVITGIGNRKKQIVEQSIKDFGIEDLSNWSTKNSKELMQVRKNLEKNLKDIYTIDEVGYNNAKSLLNEQYFESIFKNSNLDNLRFISEVYFRNKNFLGKDISEIFPDNIKAKLKELDEKVSVKYDEEGNVLNPGSLEHEMTTILGKYLEDIGLLRYKKDGYKRGVITKEMYDYLKKNQKDLGLEDIPDFQEFIKKGYDTTLQQTGDIPKWMSSILKKSKNMEKYHIQDPITRMISYADEVGQLIANKETVDIINNARKAGKDINQYIGKEADDFARKALGLHDVGIKGKIAGKISGGLGATAIIGSLPIMAMSGFTTLLRATPVILKNIMGLNIGNINKTIDFLEKTGIEQKFINETGLDKIIGANYSIFGGGTFDKRVKGQLGSMIIKNQLNSLGVKLGKGDDLIEVYQNTLNKLPVEQSNKLISDIGRQLNDLSDFSNLSRGQIHGLDSRIFNTFKNFGRTTTSRYLSYPTQVVNEVYSSMKNGLSKSDLTDRSYQKIAFLLADTLGIYLGAKLIIDKLLPQEDEEKKEILANKLSGGSVKDKLAMLLSYPLQQPGISMISSTFNNIVKLVEDISNNGLQKDQIDYAKISGLVRQLSLLMKDKELTSGGTYKYNNEWGDNTIQNTLKFILGYSDGRLDYEVAKKNIDKIKEGDKGLISSVVDKIISDQNFFYSGLGETFDIAKYALGDRDTKNDFYNFTVRSQSKKNLDTLLSNIKSGEKVPMTAEEWIANAWNGFDIKAEDKDIMGFMKNNLTSNKTAQKELLKAINEVGINNDPLYKGDMNQYMEQLKTKNPALFYQIIKKVINPIIIKIDKDKKTLKDLQYTGSEAGTSFVDEILVDRFENLPRIASDIANRFDKIISENPTDEELDSYNELIKTTQKLPYLWDNITDSLSTIVGKRLKGIEGIKDKLDGLPELQNALKQAAILRGIKFKKQENNLVDNIKNIGQTTPGDEKTSTTTGLQATTGYAPQKKKSELLKLETPKQKKSEPLFKTQQQPSLAEILLRK